MEASLYRFSKQAPWFNKLLNGVGRGLNWVSKGSYTNGISRAKSAVLTPGVPVPEKLASLLELFAAGKRLDAAYSCLERLWPELSGEQKAMVIENIFTNCKSYAALKLAVGFQDKVTEPDLLVLFKLEVAAAAYSSDVVTSKGADKAQLKLWAKDYTLDLRDHFSPLKGQDTVVGVEELAALSIGRIRYLIYRLYDRPLSTETGSSFTAKEERLKQANGLVTAVVSNLLANGQVDKAKELHSEVVTRRDPMIPITETVKVIALALFEQGKMSELAEYLKQPIPRFHMPPVPMSLKLEFAGKILESEQPIDVARTFLEAMIERYNREVILQDLTHNLLLRLNQSGTDRPRAITTLTKLVDVVKPSYRLINEVIERSVCVGDVDPATRGLDSHEEVCKAHENGGEAHEDNGKLVSKEAWFAFMKIIVDRGSLTPDNSREIIADLVERFYNFEITKPEISSGDRAADARISVEVMTSAREAGIPEAYLPTDF